MTSTKRGPGPIADRVKIEGNWEDAVKTALAKPPATVGQRQSDVARKALKLLKAKKKP